MGVYATYKGCKNGAFDVYYLRLEDEAVDFDTLGTRLLGSRGPWSWELEAAIQFGDYQRFNHDAGAWTLGLGRKLEDLPWSPTVWGYYDWASGANETNNGYHHLFPLSHKYLGFMDLFGYSHFFAGNYYFNTAGVPHRGDADFFYTQFTLNF